MGFTNKKRTWYQWVFGEKGEVLSSDLESAPPKLTSNQPAIPGFEERKVRYHRSIPTRGLVCARGGGLTMNQTSVFGHEVEVNVEFFQLLQRHR